MKLKLITYNISPAYDELNVRWQSNDNKISGLGFISKGEDKRIGLLKCPLCHNENYALNVMDGLCSWCGFNANKHENHVTNI